MKSDLFYFFFAENAASWLSEPMSIKLCCQSFPEHVSEAEQCGAQLNIPLCGRAIRPVAHGQSKRSTNVPLTLTGKPNPAQIMLSH